MNGFTSTLFVPLRVHVVRKYQEHTVAYSISMNAFQFVPPGNAKTGFLKVMRSTKYAPDWLMKGGLAGSRKW